jgi:hypothetical protein
MYSRNSWKRQADCCVLQIVDARPRGLTGECRKTREPSTERAYRVILERLLSYDERGSAVMQPRYLDATLPSTSLSNRASPNRLHLDRRWRYASTRDFASHNYSSRSLQGKLALNDCDGNFAAVIFWKPESIDARQVLPVIRGIGRIAQRSSTKLSRLFFLRIDPGFAR